MPDGARAPPVVLPRAQHIISYHVVTAARAGAGSPGARRCGSRPATSSCFPTETPMSCPSRPPAGGGPDAGEVLDFIEKMSAGQLPFVVVEDGGGPESLRLVCGFLGCDTRPFNPLLATLPHLLHVRPPPGVGRRLAAPTRRSRLAESRERRAGRRVHPAAAERADVRRGRAAISGRAARASRRAGWRACATRRRPRARPCCTSAPAHLDAATAGARGRPVALGAGGPLRPLRRASRRCST